MKRRGIMNPQLNRIIAEMGHRDMLIISDMGLPIPKGVERVDLCLKCGIPSFKEVLKAIISELKVEEFYLADDIKEKNPKILNIVKQTMDSGKENYISHKEFKEISKNARAIVRTGECSPFANIILISGVIF